MMCFSILVDLITMIITNEKKNEIYLPVADKIVIGL